MSKPDIPAASEAPAGTTSAINETSDSKLRASTWRGNSTSKPKVSFKSQTWSNASSKPHNSSKHKSKPTPTVRTAESDAAEAAPVTKHQSRFASLFISMLAVSPVAVEYEAVDEETMESAKKASTAETKPAATQPKKSHRRVASTVKPSEIRKTRWKRFKYEMGLKMKPKSKKHENERKQSTAGEQGVELENMRSEGAAQKPTAKADDMN